MADYVSLSDQRRMKITLPHITEQRQIARILGALDDKIELNRRMNATLEATARAIFKAWFVDFVPVRAKAEGRQPEGMDAETAAWFPYGFEESELGLIPSGWRIATLGNFIELQKGLSYKGESLSDNGIPMINLGCFLGEGRFSRANLKHYSGEFKERHLVNVGDIVVANTDMTQNRVVLGSPAIVPLIEQNHTFLFTHHVYSMRFKYSIDLWRLFIFYSLLQPSFRERVVGFAAGTTVLALPKEALMNLNLVIPSEDLLTVFNSMAQPLRDFQEQNEAQSLILAETRDTLLPKLISGEVRI